jgi:sugar lactone lactonase YvrE
MRWSEGPVYFGDARCVYWSDIPNNRIMRWDEVTGRATRCVDRADAGRLPAAGRIAFAKENFKRGPQAP